MKLMETVKWSDLEYDVPKKKRCQYTEGYSEKDLPLSLVKKLFILCAVSNED